MESQRSVVDTDTVRHAYRRWAPIYDYTFGQVADAGRKHAVRIINKRTGNVRHLTGAPGESGSTDGSLEDARFDKPSGLAIYGDLLYVTESRYSSTPGPARLRRIALILGGAIPVVLAALATQLPDVGAALVALIAVISAGAGLLVERWLFFAEAVHTVSLYYGTEAA